MGNHYSIIIIFMLMAHQYPYKQLSLASPLLPTVHPLNSNPSPPDTFHCSRHRLPPSMVLVARGCIVSSHRHRHTKSPPIQRKSIRRRRREQPLETKQWQHHVSPQESGNFPSLPIKYSSYLLAFGFSMGACVGFLSSSL